MQIRNESYWKREGAMLIPLIVSFFFLIYKNLMLRIGMYKSDVYSFYQEANDWLIDKPLYFENTFGFVFQHHTYYLIPALAPFTQIFGINGLFVAQWILLLLACREWILSVDLDFRFTRGIGLTILIFGPLGFYLWDNITYGWHLESLAFPLSIWAAALLYNKKNKSAFGVLFLLCLVREECALQAAAIYSMFQVLRYFTFKIKRRELVRNVLLAYGVGILIFLVNLAVLRWGKGDLRFSQSANGWDSLLNDKQYGATYIWTIVKYSIAILGSVPFFLLVFRNIPKKFFTLYLFVLPAFVLGFIAGLYYYPQESFSVVWAPRLYFTSSLILIATLFILGEYRLRMKHAKVRLALLFIFQFMILYMPTFNRYYNPVFFTRIAFGKEISPEHTQMLKDLKLVSDCMNERQTVVVDEFLAFAFEKHDFILTDKFVTSYIHQPEVAVLRTREVFDKFKYFEAVDSVSFPQLKVYFAQENHPLKQKISECALMRPNN